MFRKCIITALITASLAACATIPLDSRSFSLLDDALGASPTALETQAEKGKGRAQYALSLVYRYGLHGVPRDNAYADAMRRRAVASRGYMPITQYIAGLNGKPGRTHIINVPRYDVSAYEVAINDRCASALDNGAETPGAFDACGGELSFRSLKDRWARATAP